MRQFRTSSLLVLFPMVISDIPDPSTEARCHFIFIASPLLFLEVFGSPLANHRFSVFIPYYSPLISKSVLWLRLSYPFIDELAALRTSCLRLNYRRVAQDVIALFARYASESYRKIELSY